MGNEESDMARIVIRCRYTGHYIISGHDASTAPGLPSGRIFCPYCTAEHVWSSTEASASEREARRKPLVRQAS
jgi:hypothetical protein